VQGNLFSESWYRIADLRVNLLYTVRVQKQLFRGSTFYVLHDPFNNRFFRVRPEAYEFLIRLNADQTVEQTWEECLKIRPDDTPTQDEVIRLLSQLHHGNLLYFQNKGDSERLFERYKEGRKRFFTSTFMSILFLKIPLWDPEQFLKKSKPIIDLLISVPGLIIWILVVCLGATVAISNFRELFEQSQGMLAPSNLVYLYICLVSLKVFHELGHAAMTKRFGGEVHTMGIMFLVFTPLPYMDASSSWAFRNKWHRVLVGAAGMIVELFFASIAVWIWANSGEGLVRGIAFNVMMIGSISSFFFNGNPLTRLDSYYILSDWLEIPNLAERAKKQWFYCIEHLLYGIKEIFPPADSLSEGFWLLLYGFFSFLYRILISIAIAMFVLDQWFEAGILILILSLFAWILRPIWKGLTYLFTDQRLGRQRKRAYLVTSLVVGAAVFGLCIYPASDGIRAPGVIQAQGFLTVYTPVAGILHEIKVRTGQRISKGDLLMSLENPELELEIRATEAQLAESRALELKARKIDIADLKPIAERLKFLERKVLRLEGKKIQHDILAQVDGHWVAPDLDKYKNVWLSLGSELGAIIPDDEMRFFAVVSQEQASNLFSHTKSSGEVKIYGREEFTLAASSVQVIPFERKQLPSVALGWFGGGSIQVNQQDGMTTAESFFEVHASLEQGIAPVSLLHGRTGELRIDLPPKSLWEQLRRGTVQLMQRRYKI
jgi:putative peptide zinc metalloprotease protein